MTGLHLHDYERAARAAGFRQNGAGLWEDPKVGEDGVSDVRHLCEMEGLKVFPSDGPWEWSGPEEGDTIDTSVWVCHEDADNWEVFEITEGTTRQKKAIAKQIAKYLNKGGVQLWVNS